MRAKLKTVAPKSREEMEELVGEIAELKISERDTKAEMDAELKSVRDRYQESLAAIETNIAQRMPRALAWAELHEDEFEGRSLQMVHGRIGWRMTPHSLKPMAGWTWARVLEAVKKAWPCYIRTKEEVNREAILADREKLGCLLRVNGLRVVQEDEFYVEPKVTETQNREKVSA